MSATSNKIEHKTTGELDSKTGLTLHIVSFGYKLGKPPTANALFDVRFLKNPYWVEHLRPLTGKDYPVQEYVMNQKVARDFLDGLVDLLVRLIPQLKENSLTEFHIAFGCTGGQHRSATMVELLAKQLGERFPELTIERVHRELDGKSHIKHDIHEDSKKHDKLDSHEEGKSPARHNNHGDSKAHKRDEDGKLSAKQVIHGDCEPRVVMDSHEDGK